MNDLKMNIAETMSINLAAAKSYATVSNTGEIEITGTEDEIRRCIENTPQHLKFTGHLVLEILRLRAEQKRSKGLPSSVLLASLNAQREHAEKRYNEQQSLGDSISIASTRGSFCAWVSAYNMVAPALVFDQQ